MSFGGEGMKQSHYPGYDMIIFPTQSLSQTLEGGSGVPVRECKQMPEPVCLRDMVGFHSFVCLSLLRTLPEMGSAFADCTVSRHFDGLPVRHACILSFLSLLILLGLLHFG